MPGYFGSAADSETESFDDFKVLNHISLKQNIIIIFLSILFALIFYKNFISKK